MSRVNQFGSLEMAVIVFVCLNLIQFIVGSYFEPRIARGALPISPFLFWSFLWGIAGAFIGVPIVIAALTLCEQHRSTRWIADLAGRLRGTESVGTGQHARITGPREGIVTAKRPRDRATASGGRRRALFRLAWPEGHDKPDHKHSREEQKQHGLFEPRDRRHGDGHSDAQEANLQR
jgi:hypothetical protein